MTAMELSNQKKIVTLLKAAKTEFEEKKSVFIGFAAPVSGEDEAMAYLKAIRKEYPDATHHVWAYLMNDGALARYSDDGEPQGTAGVPVLEAIKKKAVTNAVVIVTRYFGGTLLGAGGLVRCYTRSAHEALEAAGIAVYEPFQEMTVSCTYSDYQKVVKELPGFYAIVDETRFEESVIIRIAIPGDLKERFELRMSELTNARIKIEKNGFRMERKPENSV